MQNLEITGRTNPNGEPQRILRLLEKAVQSGAQNQKSSRKFHKKDENGTQNKWKSKIFGDLQNSQA